MSSTIAISILTYSVCGVGVCTNLLLLYTILTKTPDALKSFSVLLLNSCLTDCLQCIAVAFVIIRISSIGRSIIIIPQGLCNYFGEQACVAGFALTMALYSNIFFANTACFVFRYHVLKKGKVLMKDAVLYSLLLLLPSVGMFLTCEYAINSSSHSYIAEIARDLDGAEGYSAFGIEDYRSGASQFYLFLSLFSSPIHYGIMIYTGRKVLHMLDSNSVISETTRKGHVQLMKAITLQACIPPLIMIDITFYALMQLGVIHWPFLEQLLCLWGLIGCTVSPLIHLYFITPYREAVFAIFGVSSARSISDIRVNANKPSY